VFDKQEDTPGASNTEGELFSFDQMREKIYSEVANLISQNETRPFYLINLFKELQLVKEKNARDQVLKSVFNIANRQRFVGCEGQSVRSETKLSSRSETASETARAKQQRGRPAAAANNRIEIWTCPDADDDSVSFQYRAKKFKSMNKSAKGLQKARVTQSGRER